MDFIIKTRIKPSIHTKNKMFKNIEDEKKEKFYCTIKK